MSYCQMTIVMLGSERELYRGRLQSFSAANVLYEWLLSTNASTSGNLGSSLSDTKDRVLENACAICDTFNLSGESVCKDSVAPTESDLVNELYLIESTVARIEQEILITFKMTLFMWEKYVVHFRAWASTSGEAKSPFNEDYFKCERYIETISNGEEVHNLWKVYSKSKDAVFCFHCLLFADTTHIIIYQSGLKIGKIRYKFYLFLNMRAVYWIGSVLWSWKSLN